MDPLVAVQIVVAAAQDIAFAVLVGALACSLMIDRHGLRVPVIAGRLRFGAACLLALGCGLYLWLQSAVMSGAPFDEAGAALGAVLTQSHFGIAWAIGACGALLTVLSGMGSRPVSQWLAVAGALVYAAGKAAAGHAADAGDFKLPEMVHVVHLCATAAWAGSVLVSALLLHRQDAKWLPRRDERVAFYAHLSYLATVALGLVIVTGIYNATQDTAHLSAPLLSVPYGQLLTAKLTLVIVAVVLGAYNRMIYLPRFSRVAGGEDSAVMRALRSFERLLVLEALAMLGVLIVAAILGHTSPSGG